ncbi:MAG: acyloxyacyl hydrolase [Fimbriimonadaceae bacterium]|nr:acyloxyacyl hydrolase [Fimbriimonadaceae bacterium]QYK55623.1 MAG: acyloxyacyl hydrolase [Fimbriimonadaceae bacterium]
MVHHWPLALALFPIVACAAPETDQKKGPSWYVKAGPVFGQSFIGSEDTRRGAIYAIGYENESGMTRIRNWRGSYGFEFYYMFTKGGGFEHIPVNNMRSYGALFRLTYPVRLIPRLQTHLELGWGLVYNSITTRDLDSKLNSTPVVGLVFDVSPWLFQARFFHMSNGGLKGDNQGSNQFQFLVGYRF